MKNYRAACAALALLASCVGHTELGPCIGAFDEPDPTLRYKVSGWNIAMGVVFIETIIAPIVVVTDDFRCPVGRKEAPAAPRPEDAPK